MTNKKKHIIIICLSLIALLVIGFRNISITRTISFQDCNVEYKFYLDGDAEIYKKHYITNKDELRSANRKLALCLCEKYQQTNDKELKNNILELANQYGEKLDSDMSIEFIIDNRMKIFDPVIYID
jgi:hypothetical protein